MSTSDRTPDPTGPESDETTTDQANPAEAPGTPEEGPVEGPVEGPEEISEETAQKTPEETPQETPQEIPDERAARLAARAREGRALVEEEYRRTSRRSFLGGALGLVAGVAGFRWVQTQEHVDGIPAVLRRGHEFNDGLWRALGATDHAAPEFPLAAAEDLRRNGRNGISEEIDLDDWSMRVEGPDGRQLDELVLADVMTLPTVDMVTEHKCIEGWSQVAHWTGTRFSDFAARYADRIGDAGFVGMETPNEGYYVGLERADMLHPQTLLAWGLGGEPLTQDHGAPLRLYTPNHYGIKSLKRIGVIRFTRERPPDYWAERSYDWNSRL